MSTNELQERPMNYEVNGEQVKLTMNTVRNYLIRGDEKKVTDAEIVMFMNLCKYQKLNPFLNEAYLVKFGSDAQIITGKEAFMKRAESHEKYEGFKAGVIVESNGEITQREGTFSLPSENLVGGWAEVYRSDRKHPIVAQVSMKEYNKGKSTWTQIPATMIRKTALVQALREAFPSDLGSMYTAEEVQERVDVTPHATVVQQEIQANANTEVLDFPQEVLEPPQAPEVVQSVTQESEIAENLQLFETGVKSRFPDAPGF